MTPTLHRVINRAVLIAVVMITAAITGHLAHNSNPFHKDHPMCSATQPGG